MVAGPFLVRAQACQDVLPQALHMPAGFAWRKANGRRQYLRARLEARDGQLRVCLHPQQGSAMLTSACWADGLALVEVGQTLEEGDLLDYLPFSALLH